MRSVELGRTGLRVSRLGLGLASIGGMFAAVPESEAIATIDRAWELGIRLFDTAPVYGYGLSEQRAGLALRGRPRNRFVLCSKVGRLIEPGGPDIQPIWAEPPAGVGPRLDYSYGAVMRSFEESLERMGIDRIDILHVHDPDLDYATASTDAMRALAELRGRGTIRAISLGVNHADVAARFLRDTGPVGPDCILLAGRYSLLDQSGADELLPLCEKLGVAVLAAGVFQGGVLRPRARRRALLSWCDASTGCATCAAGTTCRCWPPRSSSRWRIPPYRLWWSVRAARRRSPRSRRGSTTRSRRSSGRH